MPERSDIVYLYDGSYEGLLCCIFESYEKKELPLDIQIENAEQTMLYHSRMIDTDDSKADRVKVGIRKKASHAVYDLVELGFYTCHPQKERLILNFAWLGMKYGKNVLSMLTDDTVRALQTAVNALLRESHLLKGFIRFSVYGEILAAVIKPRNYVLPLLSPHFCGRYSNETFMIYDTTHHDALLYKPRQFVILPLSGFDLPDANEEELLFRSLWKLFYDTISINERCNPTCRMSLMPKRYWECMTEMNDCMAPRAKVGNKQEGLTCSEFKRLNEPEEPVQ